MSILVEQRLMLRRAGSCDVRTEEVQARAGLSGTAGEDASRGGDTVQGPATTARAGRWSRPHCQVAAP